MGLGHFWPADIAELSTARPTAKTIRMIGEIRDQEDVPRERLVSAGLTVPEGMETCGACSSKVGNRDVTGLDFTWILGPDIQSERYPEALVVIERREWGNFYGYLREVHEAGATVASGAAGWACAA